VTGCRLLRNANIQSRLAEVARRACVRNEAGVDRVLSRLVAIAFSDLRQAATWGPRGVALVDSKTLPDDVAVAIESVSEDKDGNVKIKRSDQIRALELIGKYHKMFVERLEHGGDGGGPIVFALPRAGTGAMPEIPVEGARGMGLAGGVEVPDGLAAGNGNGNGKSGKSGNGKRN